jgi:hypothetical protein
LLVAFWIVAARQHAQPFKPFALTSHDFAGYCPAIEGASVTSLVVSASDPAEPNIAAFGMTWNPGPAPARVGIRLVHGYNMPMCMKIKGYTVEPVGNMPDNRLPVQVWRVTSSSGEVAIWLTTMIRAEDFSVTQEAVTSMAFPRVDIPDDPNWVPRGFTMDDLWHPVQAFQTWFRTRWNASRTDWLTFLRLRQPAWASEELLTYVSRSMVPSVTPANEAEVIRLVAAGHRAMLKELQEWRRIKNPAAGQETGR